MKRFIVLSVLAVLLVSVFAVAGCAADDEVEAEETEQAPQVGLETPKTEDGGVLDGEGWALGHLVWLYGDATVAGEDVASVNVTSLSGGDFGYASQYDMEYFADEDVNYYYFKVELGFENGDTSVLYDAVWVDEDDEWATYLKETAGTSE